MNIQNQSTLVRKLVIDLENVVIIRQSSQFVTTQLRKGLIDYYTNQVKLPISVMEISFDQMNIHVNERTKLVILFVNGEVSTHQNYLLKLRDLIIENDIILTICCYRTERNQIIDLFAGANISHIYEHDLNIQNIIKELEISLKTEKRQKATILMIDDDVVYTKYVKSYLSSDYVVIIENNALDAIKRLANLIPDLILLDLEMPKLDGSQLLDCMRDNPMFKTIPVLILSGHAEEKMVKSVINLDISGYILKTSKVNQIKEIIDKVVKETKLAKLTGK